MISMLKLIGYIIWQYIEYGDSLNLKLPQELCDVQLIIRLVSIVGLIN